MAAADTAIACKGTICPVWRVVTHGRGKP